MKLSDDPTVPVLEGWVNITEAAEILDITRQYAWRRAGAKHFKSLHRVGSQPVFVVATSELDEMIAARKAKAEQREAEADPEPDENSAI